MKKRIFSMILVTILMIFGITNTVNAADQVTVTMTPSQTTVPEATEFTVKVKVSNVDVGTNGINSLSGYLKYDTEVFETISESSIEKLNDWTFTFDESTNKISLTKSTFVKSAQDIFQVSFKTKSGVSGKSGSISFTGITASNSESDIKVADISTPITVGAADASSTADTSNASVISSNTSSNNTANTSNITNTNTASNNTTVNTVSGTNTANTNVPTQPAPAENAVSGYVNTMSNTTSGDDMPKTGVSDTILGLIFVVIGVAIVFFVKIEKLNKDIR